MKEFFITYGVQSIIVLIGFIATYYYTKNSSKIKTLIEWKQVALNFALEQVVRMWKESTKEVKLAFADGHIDAVEKARLLKVAKDEVVETVSNTMNMAPGFIRKYFTNSIISGIVELALKKARELGLIKSTSELIDADIELKEKLKAPLVGKPEME